MNYSVTGKQNRSRRYAFGTVSMNLGQFTQMLITCSLVKNQNRWCSAMTTGTFKSNVNEQTRRGNNFMKTQQTPVEPLPASDLFAELEAIGSKIAGAKHEATSLELPAYGRQSPTRVGSADLGDLIRHLSKAQMALDGIRRTLELNGHSANGKALPTASDGD